MRITYRREGHKDYWSRRWHALPVDLPMQNSELYPLKYAIMTTEINHGLILEAGCGAGRILRYYHERGYDIIGFDYIESIIEKLRSFDLRLKLNVADVTCMPYADNTFSSVLAFGLLHNLKLTAAHQAMQEIKRVLKYNGRVCISFRADNLQNKINDHCTSELNRNIGVKIKYFSTNGVSNEFHKLNLTRDEFESLVTESGLIIERFFPVQNMPILYKYRIFRAAKHKNFNESLSRAEGYRLSIVGKMLQWLLLRFPNSFCNLYVVIARKPQHLF